MRRQKEGVEKAAILMIEAIDVYHASLASDSQNAPPHLGSWLLKDLLESQQDELDQHVVVHPLTPNMEHFTNTYDSFRRKTDTTTYIDQVDKAIDESVIQRKLERRLVREGDWELAEYHEHQENEAAELLWEMPRGVAARIRGEITYDEATDAYRDPGSPVGGELLPNGKENPNFDPRPMHMPG